MRYSPKLRAMKEKRLEGLLENGVYQEGKHWYSTLTGISITNNFDFNQNFDLSQKFRPFNKSSTFSPNFRSLPTFLPFNKISTIQENFDLTPKFRSFTKISTFQQNFYFSTKVRPFTKISIFHQNFDLSPNIQYLTKISILYKTFLPKFRKKNNNNFRKHIFSWFLLVPLEEIFGSIFSSSIFGYFWRRVERKSFTGNG